MGSVFGKIEYEMPRYEVVAKQAEYEVRAYSSQIRAEYEFTVKADVPMDKDLTTPFFKLADFIFGKNTAATGSEPEKVAMTSPVVIQVKSEKIAMTAPVVIQEQPGESVPQGMSTRKMAFILPSKYTSVDQVPVPADPTVRIIQQQPYKAAAITFSGYMTAATVKSKEAQLREACAREGVALVAGSDAVQYCGYNPPLTLPWLTRNEVLITVAE